MWVEKYVAAPSIFSFFRGEASGDKLKRDVDGGGEGGDIGDIGIGEGEGGAGRDNGDIGSGCSYCISSEDGGSGEEDGDIGEGDCEVSEDKMDNDTSGGAGGEEGD
jgi:hypothetical protein